MKTMKLTLLLFLIGGMIVCINGCDKEEVQPTRQTYCFICEVDSIVYPGKKWITGIRQICNVTQEYIDTNANVYYPDSLRRAWRCDKME